MRLAEVLGIGPGVTAVVGSGGKTTLLRALGTALAAEGARVILCTTTRIFPFPGLPNLLSPTEVEATLASERLVCVGTMAEGGKLTTPGLSMDALASLAEYVLVEADGAAGRPLKAHAPWEPVIPPEAGRTVCVIGASGFGRPIAEAAHRPERFAELAGGSVEDAAEPEAAARVLAAEGLADVYFFNQADTPRRRELARRGAEALGRPAVVGSLEKGVWERCW